MIQVTKRAGMLTDPPQRIVSISCRGIAHNSLTLVWSQPLRSYDEEVFVGYLVCTSLVRYKRYFAQHSSCGNLEGGGGGGSGSGNGDVVGVEGRDWYSLGK